MSLMKQKEITPSKSDPQQPQIELTVYRPSHKHAPALMNYMRQVQSTKAAKNNFAFSQQFAKHSII